MSEDTLSVALAGIEARHLLAIVDDLLTLLSAPVDAEDAALDRLAPSPYPADPVAAEEYRRSTRDDLVAQRIADARVVRAALLALEPSPDHDPAGALAVDVPRSELDAWLRTLSAIRLVLASRLGIDHDDAHDHDDPRYGTYDWLGYRLELLVQLADVYDAR